MRAKDPFQDKIQRYEDDECKTDSRFKNFTSAKPKAPKRMEVKANWWETWADVEETMRPTRSYNQWVVL